MLDGVSLDQLRTFIAAVDEGSFSAASNVTGIVSDTYAIAKLLHEHGALRRTFLVCAL